MRLLISATCLALALTACGGGGDDESDESSPFGEVPSCADVLVAGETLPADYEGCEDDEGAIVPVLVYDDCKDGRTYLKLSEEFGAFEGDVISEDPQALFDECYGY